VLKSELGRPEVLSISRQCAGDSLIFHAVPAFAFIPLRKKQFLKKRRWSPAFVNENYNARRLSVGFLLRQRSASEVHAFSSLLRCLFERSFTLSRCRDIGKNVGLSRTREAAVEFDETIAPD